MSRVLYGDSETYSEADLKKVGGWVYSKHPTTECLLFTYALDDGPVQCWDGTDEPYMPDDLECLLHDPSVELVAHNAQFDRWMIEHVLGIPTDIERWRCTMAKAYTMGLPGSLGQLASALKLDDDSQKIADGKRLIRKFCMPQPKNRKVSRHTAETDPEDWQAFTDYAIRDTHTLREIDKAIPNWNYRGDELALWRLDQRINDRGLPVDVPLAKELAFLCDRELARLNGELAELTGGAVTANTQRDKTLAWLNEQGVNTTTFRKADVTELLARDDLPANARRVIEIRQEAGRSSTAKYVRFGQTASPKDHRIRGAFQYGGAMRTLRWAGRLIQPQNFPRPSKGFDGDLAAEAVMNGTADMLYDNVMALGADSLRSVIAAPKGKKLVAGDYSSIEGRVLAWLAGEQWKLDAFSNYDQGEGHDLYVLAYARAFSVEPDSVTKDQRFIGKVTELACIAENQPVLTDHGLVPIQDVTTDHCVWDGVEFVRHDGVVSRGYREVISYDGLTATPDHIVWAEGAHRPIRLDDAAARRSCLVQSGAGGNPLRVDRDNEQRAEIHESLELLLRIRVLCRLWAERLGRACQLGIGQEPRVPGVFAASSDSSAVGSCAHGGEVALREPPGQRVEKLWCQRYTVRLPERYGSGLVGDKEPRPEAPWERDRPHRQRRALRRGQSALGHTHREQPEQTQHEGSRNARLGEPLRISHNDADAAIRNGQGGDIQGGRKRRSRETKELADNSSEPHKARVYDIVNCGPRNRFTVAGRLVHNCGYQGAVGAFAQMAANFGAELPENEAARAVQAWRLANPAIVAFWYQLEEAAKYALRTPGQAFAAGPISFKKVGHWLLMKLPSGRFLCYYGAKLHRGSSIRYEGLELGKWRQLDIYGGKFAENATQAVARDVMGYAMPLVEAVGYEIIGTVHDELISEVGKDFGSPAGLRSVMSTVPPWAEGLPLAATAWEGPRYRK